MWVYSRLLLSTLAGFSFLMVGVFALVRHPRRRLNQSFAVFGACHAAVNLVGLIFSTNLPNLLFVYRLAQLASPIGIYALIRFVQDWGGIFDHKASKVLRGCAAGYIALMAPFCFNDLWVRDFVHIHSETAPIFIRIPGPMAVVNNLLYAVFFLAAFVTAVGIFKTSFGFRRRQMKGIMIALSFHGLAIFSYIVSTRGFDMPWLYFPLQIAEGVIFAYAIWRYDLFESELWGRRLLIVSIVYAIVLGLPFLFFFSAGHSLLSLPHISLWWTFSLFSVVYGILFAFAPALITFLRQKNDDQRWLAMRQHLAVVREASERLSEDRSLTIETVSAKALEILKDFYWNRIKNPPVYVGVVMAGQNADLHVAEFPSEAEETLKYKPFFETLRELPALAMRPGFGAIDLEETDTEKSAVVRAFLIENRIEFCCPAVHEGKLKGAVLIGESEKGISSKDELSTLRLFSSHVAAAVRRLELMNRAQELHDIDELKKQLIGNIAHEFKSPLAVIESSLSVLIEELNDGRLPQTKLKEYLGMLFEHSNRLSTFVQDLMDLTRIEEARVTLNPSVFPVAEVARKVVSLYGAAAENKGVKLTAKIPKSIKIEADQDRVQQILSNLVSNAIKFTEQGEINMTAVLTGDNVLISVKDTGKGIEKNYLPLIFERFFQVPNQHKQRYKGTGLGLAIAKGWTAAHGGSIWAESDGLGRGTTILVELPLRQPEQA